MARDVRGFTGTRTPPWIVVPADNSLDYSLGNTTKQALWLNTSRESKYKAKQAVDSFFVRAGDVIQAGVVFGGERLALAVPSFAALNVVLTGLWLGVVAMLNVSLARQASAEPPVTSAAPSGAATGPKVRIVS